MLIACLSFVNICLLLYEIRKPQCSSCLAGVELISQDLEQNLATKSKREAAPPRQVILVTLTPKNGLLLPTRVKSVIISSARVFGTNEAESAETTAEAT
jgi:hypothetical protein